MSPQSVPGKLFTLNLAVTIWGVRLGVAGTVEMADVRIPVRDLEDQTRR
jgi:hypothetical protein